MSDVTILSRINGNTYTVDTDVRTTVLDLLLERLHMTGTKRDVTTDRAAPARRRSTTNG